MKSDGLVTSVAEVRENLGTMARYALGDDYQREFHRGRIKNGKNFVARKLGSGWQFAPSKFVGYSGNDTSHMNKLDSRDGGRTNGRLTELLGPPFIPGSLRYEEVDTAYQEYAASHGIEPSRHHQGRKYWLIE